MSINDVRTPSTFIVGATALCRPLRPSAYSFPVGSLAHSGRSPPLPARRRHLSTWPPVLSVRGPLLWWPFCWVGSLFAGHIVSWPLCLLALRMTGLPACWPSCLLASLSDSLATSWPSCLLAFQPTGLAARRPFCLINFRLAGPPDCCPFGWLAFPPVRLLDWCPLCWAFFVRLHLCSEPSLFPAPIDLPCARSPLARALLVSRLLDRGTSWFLGPSV